MVFRNEFLVVWGLSVLQSSDVRWRMFYRLNYCRALNHLADWKWTIKTWSALITKSIDKRDWVNLTITSHFQFKFLKEKKTHKLTPYTPTFFSNLFNTFNAIKKNEKKSYKRNGKNNWANICEEKYGEKKWNV